MIPSTPAQPATPLEQEQDGLPWWFRAEQEIINTDMEARVVELASDAHWQATRMPGLQVRVLFYDKGTSESATAEPATTETPNSGARLTAQLRLDPSASPANLGRYPDVEILVQRGKLRSEFGVYPPGVYLRLPRGGDAHQQSLSLRCPPPADVNRELRSVGKPEDALLFLNAGQIENSDTEYRFMDTGDESHWLRGPVEGTEIMPLHVHGRGNSMLIRWHGRLAFKPNLDPMGEEMLVLTGCLHDARGDYPAGSWVRNPIPAWQSWGGEAGTLVYYRNGHFAPPVASD